MLSVPDLYKMPSKRPTTTTQQLHNDFTTTTKKMEEIKLYKVLLTQESNEDLSSSCLLTVYI